MLPEVLDVRIEKLALGGFGIAKHQGLVVFVPNTCPGDLVRVKILENKKSFVKARVIEILEASKDRVTPPCPAFGSCGGCNWQHIHYPVQAEWKETIVKEQLQRVSDEKTLWFPIQKSAKEFRYRNRIQLKTASGKLGYFARGTHEIVDIQDCLLADEVIVAALSKIPLQMSSELKKLQISMRESGEPLIEWMEGETELPDFSQVNELQNQSMQSRLVEWAGSGNYTTVWDLYGGAGNFSFKLLQSLPKTKFVVVEGNAKAAQKARQKAQAMGLSPKKFEVYCADVSAFLRRKIFSSEDLVIVDPPRLGCEEEVIHNLAAQKFSKLIYVSCNPSTLSRDLSILKREAPERLLRRVSSFDMFPQTDHVEVMIEWE